MGYASDMPVSLMSEDLVLKLLEGHENILARDVERDRQHLAAIRCPKCRSDSLVQEIDKQRPFTKDRTLPNWNARCLECRCLFSAGTWVIIEG